MPVVAVAIAVYAGATIATVGVAAMSTWAIIGSIGAITAGVGAVTGNKDLMKVGAVMGIVGGVGALATSAGVMGTAAESATASAGAATEAAASGVVAEQTMQGVVPATADAAAVVPSAAPDVANAVVDTAADAVTTVAPAGVTPAGIVDTATAPVVTPPSADVSFFDTVKDYVKPMGTFAEKNQLLTYGMLQVGGSFMQGLFKEPTDLENAQSDLIRQRAANMAAPIPAATLTPRRNVYGATTRPTYTPPGIINAVTGRPA